MIVEPLGKSLDCCERKYVYLDFRLVDGVFTRKLLSEYHSIASYFCPLNANGKILSKGFDSNTISIDKAFFACFLRLPIRNNRPS